MPKGASVTMHPRFLPNDAMKTRYFLLAMLLTTLLVACGKGSSPAGPEPTAGTPSTPAAATKATPARATPERIAEIRAAGRSGLWTDTKIPCNGKASPVLLTWNAESAGAKHVGIYLLAKAGGNERLVVRGTPIGEKSTGAWVRPGMIFVLRNLDSGVEIQRVSIDQPSC